MGENNVYMQIYISKRKLHYTYDVMDALATDGPLIQNAKIT